MAAPMRFCTEFCKPLTSDSSWLGSSRPARLSISPSPKEKAPHGVETLKSCSSGSEPGGMSRIACRQAAAQRLSEAVEAGGVEVVVGERRQGILEQVGARVRRPRQK